MLLSSHVAGYLLAIHRYLPHRRRVSSKTRRIARYNVTHVDHHHGDELMLMNVHGDLSKLINAS